MRSINHVVYPQDILLSLSNVVDLMNPALNEHHRYVAYIAYRIAAAFGCAKIQTQNIVLAALLHDIGAFSEQERLSLLIFEDDAYAKVDLHAEAGYRLLCDFAPFATAATYIRFHHKPWHHTQNHPQLKTVVPIESHIIHLADRIAVLIRKDKNILRQIHDIEHKINSCTGIFAPELVEVFQDIALKEEFWLNILYEPIDDVLRNKLELPPIQLDSQQFACLIDLFRRIIDFRSVFTSVHSAGVGVAAGMLAELADFAPEDIYMMEIAGYLHDLGKIAIPLEILEKPASLNPCEVSIIRTHPYHTDRVLRPLPFLDKVRIWAAQHHERADGTGYPFHISGDTLSMGSRILMVADIFTALSEDRSYHKGTLICDTLDIMKHMVGKGTMDPQAYALLHSNVNDINEARIVAQGKSQLEYRHFVNGHKNPTPTFS